VKMLSTVSWVRRGAATSDPISQHVSKDEMNELISKQEGMQLEDKGEDSEDEGDQEMEVDRKLPKDKRESKFLDELNMDGYDDEPEGAEMFLGGRKLYVYDDNNQDPYVTVPDDDDESDEEDNVIHDTDSLICVGRTEGEHSSLDVYLYDESKASLFVHHELNLPAYPLSTAWIDCNPTDYNTPGNFVAVGTFEPGIEIWNLDVLDVLEPVCTLGGRAEPDADRIIELREKAKKNKKAKKKLKQELLGKIKENSHSDAVLSLCWHPAVRNRLCSGSADHSIKIWDINTQQNTQTINLHQDKVQSLDFNGTEPSILLTGGYDRKVGVVDIRAVEAARTVTVDADIECVRWSKLKPFLFLASTESGNVFCYDARNLDKPLFTLSAHDKPCSSVSWCATADMFATASVDQTIKLWELKDNKPNMIVSKNLNLGPVFCMSFDQYSTPYTLTAGGDKGMLGVWDTTENYEVTRRFINPNAPPPEPEEEKESKKKNRPRHKK